MVTLVESIAFLNCPVVVAAHSHECHHSGELASKLGTFNRTSCVPSCVQTSV